MRNRWKSCRRTAEASGLSVLLQDGGEREHAFTRCRQSILHQIAIIYTRGNGISPQNEGAGFFLELVKNLRKNKPSMNERATKTRTCVWWYYVMSFIHTNLILLKHEKVVKFMKLLKVQAILLRAHFLRKQSMKTVIKLTGAAADDCFVFWGGLTMFLKMHPQSGNTWNFSFKVRELGAL